MKSLCTILPKMSAYRRDRDETNYMFFLIKKKNITQQEHQKNFMASMFMMKNI